MAYPLYFRTAEAVQYLQYKYRFGSKSLLDHCVCDGTGPRHYTTSNGRGLRLYTPPDLDEWATGRIQPYPRDRALSAAEREEAALDQKAGETKGPAAIAEAAQATEAEAGEAA